MSEQQGQQPHAAQPTPGRPGPDEPAGEAGGEQQVVVVGPDGRPVGTVSAAALATGADGDQGAEDDGEGERATSDLVEQPAKVMRIGSMVRQLLEEVKSAPLDDASRTRLKEIHQASVTELEAGLAPELVEELQRLSLPFTEDSIPSDAELRVAQAQLVGWLEGLFHGIQTAIYAHQMAAKAQLEQGRRALPPGSAPGQPGGAPERGGMPGQPGRPPGTGDDGHSSGGMYL